MSIHFPRKTGRHVLPVLVALALLAGAGCGKGKRATVSGQVTLANGQPVTAGTITFIDKKDRKGTGTLNAQGNYTVPNAPVGEVTITISVPKMPMMMGGQPNQSQPPPGMGHMKPPAGLEPKGGTIVTDPSKIVAIPPHYEKADTSPLKFTVTAGEQKHDIKLDP